MKPLSLLFLGVVVGWAASGVDWSGEAVGQESPSRGTERSIRHERDGMLRRRGLLPPREATAPTPGTDAPPYDPNANAEPRPYVPPGFDFPQSPSLGMEELAEPVAEPTRNAVSLSGLVGRFQATAYGYPGGYGCYIVDTMTGRTWHSTSGQPPQVVADSLLPSTVQPALPVEKLLPSAETNYPAPAPQPMPAPDAAD